MPWTYTATRHQATLTRGTRVTVLLSSPKDEAHARQWCLDHWDRSEESMRLARTPVPEVVFSWEMEEVA
jgi:hypothetical protein